MLIGNQNSVNQKLTEEISAIIPIQLLEYSEDSVSVLNSSSPDTKIVVVNLMDVTNDLELVKSVKENLKGTKLIGVHCFENEAMINSILAKGYDAYISIFDFSEKIAPTLTRLGVN